MNVRRGCLASVVVVVAIFAGGASGANAQVEIDPIPGMTVASNDMTSTYGAYVWTEHNFKFKLKVSHNEELKDSTVYFIDPDGYGIYVEVITWLDGWGLEVGDTLKYDNKVILQVEGICSRINCDMKDRAITTVIVSEPITLLEPLKRASWLPPQGHVFREEHV